MTTTPPTLAGLFFCLASDPVQGFSFARIQYSHIQAFTACFAVLMQLYRPRHKTTHRTLQRLFLRLYPLNRPRYQTDKSGYNTTCATLECTHAPGHAQLIPDTTATQGRCTGQHSPPIIIRYMRGCRDAPCYGSMPDGAEYRRPCQPGGVSMLSTPGGLHSDAGSAVKGGQSDALHPAGQSSGKGRGGRRRTIGGSRRISFRAVAR